MYRCLRSPSIPAPRDGISSLCFPSWNSLQVETKHSGFNEQRQPNIFYLRWCLDPEPHLVAATQPAEVPPIHAGSDDDKVCRERLVTLGPKLLLQLIPSEHRK